MSQARQTQSWINGGLVLFSGWFMVANLSSVSRELAEDPPLAIAAGPRNPVLLARGGPLPPRRTRPVSRASAGEGSRAAAGEGSRAGAGRPASPRAVLPAGSGSPPPALPAGSGSSSSALPVGSGPPPPAPPTSPRPSAGPARLLAAGVSGVDGGYELSLRFDRPILVRSSYAPGPRLLEVSLFPVAREGLARRFPPVEFLQSVEDLGQGRKALLRIQVGTDYTPRAPLPVGERAEFRLVFEQGRQRPGLPPGARLAELGAEAVAPGLEEIRYRYQPPQGGGSDVFALVVDAAAPQLELAVAFGSDRILGRERVSEMARRAGALAGINASFFSRKGDPLGLLARRGELLSMPLLQRGVLGVFDGGRRLFIGNPGFSGRVDFAGESLKIDGVNQTRKPGKVVLYTPDWGARTGNPGGGLEVAVRGGRVSEFADGDLEIPADGFVVAVQGGQHVRRLAELAEGDEFKVVAGMTPPWNRADFALGGGPVLIREGRPRVEWREEGFSRPLVVAKAPRTAVGIRRDGRLVMAVVDGRRPGASVGVDLYELADILAELGCVDALNLDGGGSTTLVRGGRVRNRPSDGSERSVSTALLVRPAPMLAAGAGGRGVGAGD